MTLDIRTADNAAVLAVWRFGGYEAAYGTYPGRDRALSLILARDTPDSDDKPLSDVPTIEHTSEYRSGSDTPELYDVIRSALHIMCMSWSLAIVATGHMPGPTRHEGIGFTPRRCRVMHKHPFRTAVHCTAPPVRRVRFGRPLQDP